MGGRYRIWSNGHNHQSFKTGKDPRDIAKAGKAIKSGYPSCLLCKENEGYAGHLSHPARQNHRIIPITLCGEKYNLQYSPYVYYNEHCIIFNDKHIPMKLIKRFLPNCWILCGSFRIIRQDRMQISR